MNSNVLQIVLLSIVTIVLSIFLYLLNNKTIETADELTRKVDDIKKESSDFKIKYQTLKRVNDSMFVLIDNQNVKIITFQQKIKQLENDEKNFRNYISTIDDSTLYRILSETTY
jgi:peptidoglycan hydrolase CwlO-like protein